MTMIGHNYAGKNNNTLCRKCGKLHIHHRPHLGTHLSIEARKQISEKKKGKHCSVQTEYKKGHALTLSQIYKSPEHRAKIARTLREKGFHPPFRYGQIPWNKGKKLSIEHIEKLRLAHIGKILTDAQRLKISEANGGQNHWNWQGGKSQEKRGQGWTILLRKAIRKRDNQTCQICGNFGKDVHHIDMSKSNHNPTNLVTLCRSCHIQTHNGLTITLDSLGRGSLQK